METKDYIPTTDKGFDTFQDDLIKGVLPNLSTWKIPQEEFDVLLPLQTDWNTAWGKAKNKKTRNSGDVEAKDEALKLYEKAIREFVQQWLAPNKKVSNEQLIKLGLTPRNTGSSERPEIKDAPDVSFSAKSGAVIEVKCRMKQDSSRASIHPDADGAELCYKIGQPAPKNEEECVKSIVITKATYSLKLKLADASKKIYGYARWVNLSDEKKSGPFSKQAATVISD